MDFLSEASKVTQKQEASVKDIVEEQRAWLDSAGARMAELKDCRVLANLSTATCREELLQMQKNFSTAL